VREIVAAKAFNFLGLHPNGLSILIRRYSRSEELAQRCHRLAEAVLDRFPTPDRLLGYYMHDARLGVVHHRFQDLLNHRSKPSGSRATPQGDPSDLVDRRIGEHQVCFVAALELAADRSIRRF
jgi:hypothetical protein